MYNESSYTAWWGVYPPPQHPCPSCGHCPTCGQRGNGFYYYPTYDGSGQQINAMTSTVQLTTEQRDEWLAQFQKGLSK